MGIDVAFSSFSPHAELMAKCPILRAWHDAFLYFKPTKTVKYFRNLDLIFKIVASVFVCSGTYVPPCTHIKSIANQTTYKSKTVCKLNQICNIRNCHSNNGKCFT